MSYSYDRINWKDKSTEGNADNFNHMEDGIANAIDGVNEALEQSAEQTALLEQINTKLAIESGAYSPELLTSFDSILSVVASGKASDVFRVGDQIIVPYTWSGTEYQWPWDIVQFGNVELESGDTVPGMTIQAHTAHPQSMPFDPINAVYYAEDGLSIGTYYFTVGLTWGTGWVSGQSIQFTLTETVPAGAQLVLASSLYSASGDGTTMNIYSGPTSTTVLQSVTISVTDDTPSGTSLGTIGTGFNGNVCSGYSATYGYNRWSTSAYRQWLNSAEAAGSWWEPKWNFSRISSNMTSYPGFMSGFTDDFLKIIQPTKVATSLNTLVHPDGASGTEYTYDKFFLTSLEQQFINPAISGVEGDAFEYWQKIGAYTQFARSNTEGIYPLFYPLNSSTATTVRLRSCHRSNTTNVYYINSTGAVYNNNASSSYRSVPACVVCAS